MFSRRPDNQDRRKWEFRAWKLKIDDFHADIRRQLACDTACRFAPEVMLSTTCVNRLPWQTFYNEGCSPM